MIERQTSGQWHRPGNHDAPLRPLILCVEDDVINRKVLYWGLSRQYEILFATNDREACEHLRANCDQIAHVLMDIELQGSALDGVMLARLFTGNPLPDSVTELPPYAQSLPQLTVPLHFVTAYGDEYDTNRLTGAGAEGVFRKPIDFPALLAAMPAPKSSGGNPAPASQ